MRHVVGTSHNYNRAHKCKSSLCDSMNGTHISVMHERDSELLTKLLMTRLVAGKGGIRPMNDFLVEVSAASLLSALAVVWATKGIQSVKTFSLPKGLVILATQVNLVNKKLSVQCAPPCYVYMCV